ncbi:MAG TPA: type II toxin-antitoxin system VapC family toxin [Longimicrobium sp.]|nr:type II toxin-antitoxin system VapC family toxin [Longimicrobium sp.]
MIVADTNLIAYFVIPGPFTAAAKAVFVKDSDWVVPVLWRSELRSALWQHLRASQLTLPQALGAMHFAETLFAAREFEVESAPVLSLAAASNCSPYDCEFVHVAQTLGCPLVTGDKRVLAAFPGTAVSLEDFVR